MVHAGPGRFSSAASTDVAAAAGAAAVGAATAAATAAAAAPVAASAPGRPRARAGIRVNDAGRLRRGQLLAFFRTMRGGPALDCERMGAGDVWLVSFYDETRREEAFAACTAIFRRDGVYAPDRQKIDEQGVLVGRVEGEHVQVSRHRAPIVGTSTQLFVPPQVGRGGRTSTRDFGTSQRREWTSGHSNGQTPALSGGARASVSDVRRDGHTRNRSPHRHRASSPQRAPYRNFSTSAPESRSRSTRPSSNGLLSERPLPQWLPDHARPHSSPPVVRRRSPPPRLQPPPSARPLSTRPVPSARDSDTRSLKDLVPCPTRGRHASLQSSLPATESLRQDIGLQKHSGAHSSGTLAPCSRPLSRFSPSHEQRSPSDESFLYSEIAKRVLDHLMAIHEQVYTRAAQKEVERMKSVHAQRAVTQKRDGESQGSSAMASVACPVVSGSDQTGARGGSLDSYGGIDSYLNGSSFDDIDRATLTSSKKVKSAQEDRIERPSSSEVRTSKRPHSPIQNAVKLPLPRREDILQESNLVDEDDFSTDEDRVRPRKPKVQLRGQPELEKPRRTPKRRAVASGDESSDADADLAFSDSNWAVSQSESLEAIAKRESETKHDLLNPLSRNTIAEKVSKFAPSEKLDRSRLNAEPTKVARNSLGDRLGAKLDPMGKDGGPRKRGCDDQAQTSLKRQRRATGEQDNLVCAESSDADWKAISPSTTVEVDKQSSGDDQSWERSGINSYPAVASKDNPSDPAMALVDDPPALIAAESGFCSERPASPLLMQAKRVCQRVRSKQSRMENRQQREQDSLETCARTRGFDLTKWRKSKTAVVPKELEERIAISQQAGLANAVMAGKSRRGNRQEMRKLRQELQEVTRGNETMTLGLLTQRKKALMFGKSRIHGMGLYACEDIPPGDFIIEYNGEVIRRAIADVREKTYVRQGMGDSYLFRLTSDLVVDATRKGSNARFINHSCDPSVYAKIITVSGESKIVFYSKRAVRSGEELTYDYKFAFEEEDSKVACYCGAAICRKYLN